MAARSAVSFANCGGDKNGGSGYRNGRDEDGAREDLGTKTPSRARAEQETDAAGITPSRARSEEQYEGRQRGQFERQSQPDVHASRRPGPDPRRSASCPPPATGMPPRRRRRRCGAR